MSKKLMVCITVLFFSGLVYGKGAFVEVGDPSFFPENSILVKLLADDAGNIFAGYVKDQKYSVAKFDGEEWSDVGNRYFTENIGGVPSTDDTYLYTSMTLDKDGVPYVSFPSAKEYKLTVMRYDAGSNSWKTVGKAGFTDFMTTWTSVAINSEGILYVVFGDCSSESCKEAVEVYPLNDIITPVSVMKYDGTDWVYVGDPFISGSELSYSQYNSIAFDSEDVPYVAFTDTSSESKLIKVKKYNGTDWQSVGADDLTGLSGDAGTRLVDSKNDE